MAKRAFWLSVTPEPERELPEVVAALIQGGHPVPAAVARERARIERLVLRGNQRQWLQYLHEVVELIDRRPWMTDDPELARARARAAAVVSNHHNLLLALPGRGAALTAGDRARLDRLERTGPDRIEPEQARGAV
jgi:hypothetical protein